MAEVHKMLSNPVALVRKIVKSWFPVSRITLLTEPNAKWK